MKHLPKTIALSLSLAAFSFMTSPAFAQSTDAVKDKAVDMATDKAKSMAKDKVTDAVKSEMASDALVDGAEKMAKEKMSKKDWSLEKDAMSDKAIKDKAVKETGDVMTAPAVMQKPVETPIQAMPADTAVETVNIACPSGTTAQSDGTCMITGDYEAE